MRNREGKRERWRKEIVVFFGGRVFFVFIREGL